MKPETKRTAPIRLRRQTKDEEGKPSPFNLSSLKHAIEAIDTSKEISFNLSSLSVALSAASREMKQTDLRRVRRRKKKEKKEENKRKKKLMIGTKPETKEELQRWLTTLEKSLQQSLWAEKIKGEPQICELNTEFPMHLFTDW